MPTGFAPASGSTANGALASLTSPPALARIRRAAAPPTARSRSGWRRSWRARVWTLIAARLRSCGPRITEQSLLPEHQAGPEGIILVGLLGEAVTFVLAEQMPGGAAIGAD